MRWMKCTDCGHEFDDEDADTAQEYVGEFWGSPAYKTINICPNCRSEDIEETTRPEEDEE